MQPLTYVTMPQVLLQILQVRLRVLHLIIAWSLLFRAGYRRNLGGDAFELPSNHTMAHRDLKADELVLELRTQAWYFSNVPTSVICSEE